MLQPVLFGSVDRETRDVAARADASRQSQRPRVAQDLAQRPIELETWLRKTRPESMAPAVAVKPMSVDEKNRAIRARAVAEAKK